MNAEQIRNQTVIRNCMENFKYPESMTNKIRVMLINYNKKLNFANASVDGLNDCKK